MNFRRNTYQAIKNLPKDVRADVYDAVFAYVFDCLEPSLDGAASGMFELLRPELDAELKRMQKDSKSKSTRFTPPEVAQVKAYATEKGFPNFDAEKFCDFYISKGWMVGKNKMKDWKAAVRTWLKENKTNTNQDQPVTALAPRTTGDYSKHGNWD